MYDSFSVWAISEYVQLSDSFEVVIKIDNLVV